MEHTWCGMKRVGRNAQHDSSNNCAAIKTLRAHRVVGTLIGSMPHFQQQNQVLGVPLLLSPYEVTLLLRQGRQTAHGSKSPDADVVKLVLVDGTTPTPPPSAQEVEEFYKKREEEFQQQLQQALQLKQLKDKMFSTKQTTSQQPPQEQQTTEELEQPKAKRRKVVHQSQGSGPQQVVLSVLPSPSKQNAMPTVQWTFPNTEEERYKMLVFEDLWNRGYYITPGAKFGGDFLAYPGR